MTGEIELLCTLGPASMNEHVIRRMDELGVDLFRINLSHTRLEDVGETIRFVAAISDTPICLDTEGAQIRTGAMSGGVVEVAENLLITATAAVAGRPGTRDHLGLYPGDVIDRLRQGDLISIDFDAVLVQVVDTAPGTAILRVLNPGRIGSNKAVTVQRPLTLAPLTDKDREAIGIGRAEGITDFALSFANTAQDVRDIRALAGKDARIIAKIECHNGLLNLDSIIAESDAVLIDRGDLAREVPIERIPQVQKLIVARAKAHRRKVYVATNLLESMVTSSVPTRAEVNDIYNTLADGADGLVLAAETAIGRHPVACAAMVVRLIREFRNPADLDSLSQPSPSQSLLTAPHGGQLVHRVSETRDGAGLPVVRLGAELLSDVAQIALGTFSPLTGFMDRDTLESVLADFRLPDGNLWTMPIVCPLGPDAARGIAIGDDIALADGAGQVCAILSVSDIYRPDIDRVARRWFGTGAAEHPGVRWLAGLGTTFLAGAVTMLAGAPIPRGRYALTPAQLRLLFTYKGWTRVVGFHGFGVAGGEHVAAHLRAMERVHADGLLISLIAGSRGKGEFLPEVVLDSYRDLVDHGLYPQGKVVLASFDSYTRYCGPREVVFAALCRKNMGCSHFAIGGDGSDGAAPTADAAAAREATVRLLDKIGDLGIETVFAE